MVKCVVYYKATGAARIKDGVVSVLDTGTIEVRGGECLCVEGSSENGFILALCTLMDYSIVDVEVANVLGDMWPLVCTDEREGVVTAVTRVVAHPFSTWMIIAPFLGLSRGMCHSCWVSSAAKEGGWGVVNRFFIFSFHVWVDDVSENGDVAEM